MEEVEKQADSARGLASSISEEQSDWWLAELVDLVNRTPLSFGITINVSGVLVSGLLVGGKEYFEGASRTVSEAFPAEGELQELVRRLLAMPASLYGAPHENEIPQEGPAEENQERPLPGFIHLKNARFWTPARPVPFSQQRGIWWRGRLQAVDGFIFGEPDWTNEAG